MSIKIGDKVRVSEEVRKSDRGYFGDKLDEEPLTVVAVKGRDMSGQDYPQGLRIYTLSNGLKLLGYELEPYQEGNYVEC